MAPLAKLLKDVGEVTMGIGMAGMQNRDEAGAAATDYLRLIGHLSYAWLWAQMAEVAHSAGRRRRRLLPGQDPDRPLLYG